MADYRDDSFFDDVNVKAQEADYRDDSFFDDVGEETPAPSHSPFADYDAETDRLRKRRQELAASLDGSRGTYHGITNIGELSDIDKKLEWREKTRDDKTRTVTFKNGVALKDGEVYRGKDGIHYRFDYDADGRNEDPRVPVSEREYRKTHPADWEKDYGVEQDDVNTEELRGNLRDEKAKSKSDEDAASAMAHIEEKFGRSKGSVTFGAEEISPDDAKKVLDEKEYAAFEEADLHDGNIDHRSRPMHILRDENGKIEGFATAKSMVIPAMDGSGTFAVIPTIKGDVHGQTVEMSPEEAAARFRERKDHPTYGYFNTEEEAEKAAKTIDDAHQKMNAARWHQYVREHWDEVSDKIKSDKVTKEDYDAWVQAGSPKATATVEQLLSGRKGQADVEDSKRERGIGEDIVAGLEADTGRKVSRDNKLLDILSLGLVSGDTKQIMNAIGSYATPGLASQQKLSAQDDQARYERYLDGKWTEDDLKQEDAATANLIRKDPKFANIYAQDMIGSMTKVKNEASQFLDSTYLPWYKKPVSGGVKNLGYTMEFAISEAIGLGVALPAVKATMTRYADLQQSDYEVADDGTIVMTVEGDPDGKAYAKALVGGVAEAVIEKYLFENPATKWLAKTALSRTIRGNVMRYLAESKAGNVMLKTIAGFNKIKKYTATQGLMSEVGEEDAQAVVDEVVGLGRRDDEEYFGSDTLTAKGQLEIFLNMFGTMALQGGLGLAMEHAYGNNAKIREKVKSIYDIPGLNKNLLDNMSDREKAKFLGFYNKYSGNTEKLNEIADRLFGVNGKLEVALRQSANRKSAKMEQRLEQRGVTPEKFDVPIGADGKVVFTKKRIVNPYTGTVVEADVAEDTKDGHEVSVADFGDGTFAVADGRRNGYYEAGSIDEAIKISNSIVVSNQAQALDNADKSEYATVIANKLGTGIEKYGTFRELEDKFGTEVAQELYGSGVRSFAHGGKVHVILDNIHAPAQMENTIRNSMKTAQDEKIDANKFVFDSELDVPPSAPNVEITGMNDDGTSNEKPVAETEGETRTAQGGETINEHDAKNTSPAPSASTTEGATTEATPAPQVAEPQEAAPQAAATQDTNAPFGGNPQFKEVRYKGERGVEYVNKVATDERHGIDIIQSEDGRFTVVMGDSVEYCDTLDEAMGIANRMGAAKIARGDVKLTEANTEEKPAETQEAPKTVASTKTPVNAPVDTPNETEANTRTGTKNATKAAKKPVSAQEPKENETQTKFLSDMEENLPDGTFILGSKMGRDGRMRILSVDKDGNSTVTVVAQDGTTETKNESAAERNKRLSIASFVEGEGNAHNALMLWLDNGGALIHGSDETAKAYLQGLSKQDRDFLVGKKKGGGFSYDELVEAYVNQHRQNEAQNERHYDGDMTFEDVLNQALDEYHKYLEWRRNGGVSSELRWMKAKEEEEKANSVKIGGEWYDIRDLEANASGQEIYDNAVAEVEQNGGAVQNFSRSELRNLNKGDILRFDHADSDWIVESYDDKAGEIVVTANDVADNPLFTEDEIAQLTNKRFRITERGWVELKNEKEAKNGTERKVDEGTDETVGGDEKGERGGQEVGGKQGEAKGVKQADAEYAAWLAKHKLKDTPKNRKEFEQKRKAGVVKDKTTSRKNKPSKQIDDDLPVDTEDEATGAASVREGLSDILDEVNGENAEANRNIVDNATDDEVDLIFDAYNAEQNGKNGVVGDAIADVLAAIDERAKGIKPAQAKTAAPANNSETEKSTMTPVEANKILGMNAALSDDQLQKKLKIWEAHANEPKFARMAEAARVVLEYRKQKGKADPNATEVEVKPKPVTQTKPATQTQGMQKPTPNPKPATAQGGGGTEQGTTARKTKKDKGTAKPQSEQQSSSQSRVPTDAGFAAWAVGRNGNPLEFANDAAKAQSRKMFDDLVRKGKVDGATGKPVVRFSRVPNAKKSVVTPEMDAAYMDAVKRGDMETSQRMIDDIEKGHAVKFSSSMKIITTNGKESTVMSVLSKLEKMTKEDDYSTIGYDTVWGKIIKAQNRPDALQKIVLAAMAKIPYGSYNFDQVRDYLENKYGKGVFTFLTEDIISQCAVALGDRFGDKYHASITLGLNEFSVRTPEITYDDAGNVIPLSERFNDAKDDIRYRRAPADKLSDPEFVAECANRGMKPTEASWRVISKEKAEKIQKRVRNFIPNVKVQFVDALPTDNVRYALRPAGFGRQIDTVDIDMKRWRYGIASILKSNRLLYEVDESRTTNSTYYKIEDENGEGIVEIRISDHTKPVGEWRGDRPLNRVDLYGDGNAFEKENDVWTIDVAFGRLTLEEVERAVKGIIEYEKSNKTDDDMKRLERSFVSREEQMKRQMNETEMSVYKRIKELYGKISDWKDREAVRSEIYDRVAKEHGLTSKKKINAIAYPIFKNDVRIREMDANDDVVRNEIALEYQKAWHESERTDSVPLHVNRDNGKFEDGKLRYLHNDNGQTVGAFDRSTGNLYLLPGADVSTVAHELGGHALRMFAEQLAAKGDSRLLDKLNQAAKEAPKEVWDFVRDNYGITDEDELLDEVFSNRFGNEQGKRFEDALKTDAAKKWYQRLWDAIKSVWRSMTAKLGGNRIDLSAIDDMTPAQAMDFIAQQMLAGKTLGKLDMNRPGDAETVRFMRRPNPAPTSLMEQSDKKLDPYMRNIQDRFHDILSLERDVSKNLLMPIDEKHSVYHAKRVLSGMKEKQTRQIKLIADRVEKLLRDHKGEIDFDEDVGNFLLAQNAKARNAKILARTNGANVKGSGLTDQEADDILNRLKADGKMPLMMEFEKIRQELVSQWGVDYLVSGGMLDQQTADRLKQEEPFYVPHRSHYTDEDGFDMDSVRSLEAPPVKKAKGRYTMADNPLTFLFMQAADNVARVEENLVRQKLASLIRSNDNLGIGKVRNQRMTSMHDVKTGKDAIVVDVLDTESNNPNIVTFWEGGKKKVIELNGPRGTLIAAAIRGDNVKYGPEALVSAMNLYNAFATQYSVVGFKARNAVKDLFEVAINSYADHGLIHGASYITHRLPGLSNSFGYNETLRKYIKTGKFVGKKAARLKEFVENGALIGGGLREGYEAIENRMKYAADLQKGFDRAGNKAVFLAEEMLRFISESNEMTENLSRFINYDMRRNAGESIEQAVINSREDSTDFNMYGNQRWMNYLRSFANSITGGTARAVRQTVKHPARIIGLMTLLGLAEEFVDMLINGGDDDKSKRGGSTGDDISEYERSQTLRIRVGDMNLRAPIHAGPYSLFKYAGNNAMRALAGKITWEEAMKNVAVEAATVGFHFAGWGDVTIDTKKDWKSTAVSLLPTLAQPIVQLARNEDYKGSKIKVEHDYSGMENLPDSSFSKPNTAQGWVTFAQFMNSLTGGDRYKKGFIDFAPEQYKYIAEQIFKNAGKDVIQVVETLGHAISSAMERKNNFVLEDVPLANSFVRKVPGNESRYYDAVQKYKKMRDEFNARPEDKRKQDLRENLPYLDRPSDDVRPVIETFMDTIETIKKIENGMYRPRRAAKFSPGEKDEFDKIGGIDFKWSEDEKQAITQSRRILQAQLTELVNGGRVFDRDYRKKKSDMTADELKLQEAREKAPKPQRNSGADISEIYAVHPVLKLRSRLDKYASYFRDVSNASANGRIGNGGKEGDVRYSPEAIKKTIKDVAFNIINMGPQSIEKKEQPEE